MAKVIIMEIVYSYTEKNCVIIDLFKCAFRYDKGGNDISIIL